MRPPLRDRLAEAAVPATRLLACVLAVIGQVFDDQIDLLFAIFMWLVADAMEREERR